ncbi:hypothetical protein ACFX2J_021439 [Malus domestica]
MWVVFIQTISLGIGFHRPQPPRSRELLGGLAISGPTHNLNLLKFLAFLRSQHQLPRFRLVAEQKSPPRTPRTL